MRSLLFFSFLTLLVSSATAQRFYYFETNNLVDRLLKRQLEKSEQYVSASVLASEYSVRTKLESRDNSNELTLEIILADSLTQKEVFRSYEQFCFTPGKAEPQGRYSTAVHSFLQRRIGEMMSSATKDHAGFFRQEIKERKDKI